MSNENLSFVLKRPNEVAFENRPVPKIRDAKDCVIEIKRTGVCGSELHYWQAGRIGDFVVSAPMVLGHESSGIVREVGEGVSTLKVGDHVCLEPGVPCRSCTLCKSGHYNLCPRMAFAATPPFDGTLAKYYMLPEDFCYKLPDNVSLEEGALIEPLSVATHITKQAEVKPGHTVVIFGAGPVGLLCAAVCKAFGASKIIQVDINEERLAFAADYAATATHVPEKITASENAAKMIAKHALGGGADVVIEASGAETSIQTAVHVLRTGGTYVQGGMGRPEVTFPVTAMCVKEITARGSFRYSSGDYKLAVELVAQGQIDVKKLITGQVPFAEAEQALIDLKAGKGIKILIEGAAGP